MFETLEQNFIDFIVAFQILDRRFVLIKQENTDLKFNEKDFSHPSTHDILFNYFKTKFPNDWEEKCAILLGMGLIELKQYFKTRQEFYNK